MSELANVLQKTASNAAFRQRLLDAPAATLKAEGVVLPNNSTLAVIETLPDEIHLIIGEKSRPPKLQSVLDRAVADANFKQELLAHPRAVLERETAEQFPPQVRIRVHDPKRGTAIVLLPPVIESEGELSDNALEAAVGGGLFGRIKEWFCKDKIFTGIDSDGSYNQITNTSTQITDTQGSIMVW